VASSAEQQLHRDIEDRRQAGVPCDGAELSRRIDGLGDLQLNTQARHDAFREVYTALTPPGFRLMPFPDRTEVLVSGHVLHLEAVLVDERLGQVVGEIRRHFELDQRFVDHELLTIQKAYRGGSLSLVLLNQAFPFYREIDLTFVLVHAALTTGRWHWARVGFEFLDRDRVWIAEWAFMCLRALEETPLPYDFPASQLALLGTAPGEPETSFRELRDSIEQLLPSLLLDRRSFVRPLISQLESRSRSESSGSWGWLDEPRWRYFAGENGLEYDEDAPVGKIIMLGGPDWHGVFDLKDPTAEAIFDLEFQRRFP
jgi:hypothetical protein